MHSSLASPPTASRPVRPQGDLDSHLSDEELDALDAVVQHFEGSTVAGEEDAEEGELGVRLTEGERFWLTRECIIRYLKGSKWSPTHAVTRIEATLAWKRQVGVDEITADSVEAESVCGKAAILGFSNTAEPLFYITPSKRDTEPSDRQFKHIVWLWERCGDLMGPGVESVVVLLDFAGKSKRPSATLSAKILQMMTHHYPYRVGAAHVQNTPFVLNAFLSLCWPWIDPQTKSKIDLKGKVLELGHVDRSVLLKEFGGDVQFEYKHDEYWPSLVYLAATKRAAAMERWRSLGGTVGLSEWDFKAWDVAPPTTGSTLLASIVSVDSDVKEMIREDSKRLSLVECI